MGYSRSVAFSGPLVIRKATKIVALCKIVIESTEIVAKKIQLFYACSEIQNEKD